jgi:hypothetical protein
MWEPRRLTTLWTSTACYRDRLTFFRKGNIREMWNALFGEQCQRNKMASIKLSREFQWKQLKQLKVKLFLCLIRCHAMKTHREVKLRAFLISALQWLEVGGQLHTRAKKFRYSVDRRLGGAGLDSVDRRKNIFHLPGIEPRFLSHQAGSRITNRIIPTQNID